jgi:hypothetical protein
MRLSLVVVALMASSCSDPQPMVPTVPPAPLQPGKFQSPLVQLKRLQGAVGHLHVDEVRYRASDAKLFQCSYTFGVMDAKDPANLRYLSENLKHAVPGDTRTPGCIHLAADGNIVYTTHRGNLSNPTFITGWDITDPAKPKQLPVLQEPGVAYEGIDVDQRGLVHVALKDDGVGIYYRDASNNTLLRIGSLSGLGSTWGLRVSGATVFVTNLQGDLSTVDVSDPTQPRLLGKVSTGGVARGLAVDGKMAYVAAGSEGLVVIDANDLSSPKVAGKAETRGTAIRVDYSMGRAFVAAWNDARVYDVSTPSKPTFIGAVRLTTDVVYPDDGHPPVTARTLGIAANGNDIFVGNWWVQYSYRLFADRKAPSLVLPEDVNLIDFGPIAQGATRAIPIEVRNQGTAPLTLFSNWTTGVDTGNFRQLTFDVVPSQLRLEPGAKGTLSVSFKPSSTAKATSVLNILSDDPLQPLRTAFLTGNQPGLGVGKPLPETKVALLDGSEWSSSQVTDKVRVLAYFATF